MTDDQPTKAEKYDTSVSGFLKSLLAGLVRDAVKFVVGFALGTAAGAVVCWYYGIPLVFALLGGILVLGLALALSTDSLFS